MMKMDGFDDCVIGISECFDQETRIVYDLELVLNKMVQSGMTPEEAQEYYEFNQLGAYVPGCPVFLNRMSLEDIELLESEHAEN